jgi:hypothetical protein
MNLLTNKNRNQIIEVLTLEEQNIIIGLEGREIGLDTGISVEKFYKSVYEDNDMKPIKEWTDDGNYDMVYDRDQIDFTDDDVIDFLIREGLDLDACN